MKTVAFIGAYDKTDLILYTAKILSMANKRILVVDSTIMQKMRYVLPTITPTRNYITEFENIDFAIGFTSLNDIEQYIGNGSISSRYDIILLDIDSQGAMKNLEIDKIDNNLFVTGFDVYSIKRGFSIIHNTMNYTNFSKVIFSKEMSKRENEYLDYLSSQYNVIWDDKLFDFPLELGNYAVTMDNQIAQRIKIKGLSNNYKYALQYMIESIFNDEIPPKEVSKLIKILEKEV